MMIVFASFCGGLFLYTPIRQAIEDGSLQYPEDITYHSLRLTVEDYDYLIILPLDQEQEKNYSWRKGE